VKETEAGRLKKKLNGDKELWQDFVRACLKYGLKLKVASVVDLLSAVCAAIYGEAEAVEIGQVSIL
jgi:hypothetical protein